MIVVSWNCAGALRKKFAVLQDLLPDVCVVQECEDPARSASASYRKWGANSLWVGDNKNRGLGIFARPHIHLEPVALDANGLEMFLPCKIQGSVLLLGVWTRQTDSHDLRYIGQLWKYLTLHGEALSRESAIVIGDLNSNVIWDKRHSVASHSKVVRQLSGWKAFITMLSRVRRARNGTLRSSCSEISESHTTLTTYSFRRPGSPPQP
jgi:hypothetical protein